MVGESELLVVSVRFFVGMAEYHTSILADCHSPGGEPMLVETFDCIFDSRKLATFTEEVYRTYV